MLFGVLEEGYGSIGCECGVRAWKKGCAVRMGLRI